MRKEKKKTIQKNKDDKKRTAICVLGDSVAKGVIYDEIKNRYRFIKDSFVDLFSQNNKLEVTNMAKFGSTVLNGEKTLEKNIEDIKKCKYVVLEFGGNDCNYNWKEVSESPEVEHFPAVPPNEFKREYKRMIEKVKGEGCMPILLSLPPIDAKRFFDWVSRDLSKENILKFIGGKKEYIYRWHEMYNSIIFDMAQEENVRVLDIRKVFLKYPNYEDFLCADGMHPNEKGHRLISEALLDCCMLPAL